MEVGDLDGYGRYGIVDENEDGILCHTCGKRYRNLATHLTMGHGDTVPDYRARHGLAAKRRLVAQSVRARMSEGWYANKDLHLADLEKHRDPLKAVRASVPYVKQRSAGAKASRDQYLRSRAGRPLTDKEKARLDNARDVAEWSTIALEILEDLTVSVKSLARSVGMKPVTAEARIRRYRRGPGPGQGSTRPKHKNDPHPGRSQDGGQNEGPP